MAFFAHHIDISLIHLLLSPVFCFDFVSLLRTTNHCILSCVTPAFISHSDWVFFDYNNIIRDISLSSSFFFEYFSFQFRQHCYNNCYFIGTIKSYLLLYHISIFLLKIISFYTNRANGTNKQTMFRHSCQLI